MSVSVKVSVLVAGTFTLVIRYELVSAEDAEMGRMKGAMETRTARIGSAEGSGMT